MGSSAYQHSWDREREARTEAHGATMDRLQAAQRVRTHPPELDETDLWICAELEKAGIPSRPLSCFDESAAARWNYVQGPFVPDPRLVNSIVGPVAFVRACYDEDCPTIEQRRRWMLERIAVINAIPRQLLPVDSPQYLRLESVFRARMMP